MYESMHTEDDRRALAGERNLADADRPAVEVRAGPDGAPRRVQPRGLAAHGATRLARSGRQASRARLPRVL
jgi:hypothetical protein